MSGCRKALLVILLLCLLACLCSLTPMTIRYFNDDRSAFSYMIPTEIIALLDSRLGDTTFSFSELETLLAEYDLTSCHEQPGRGFSYVICRTPAASFHHLNLDPTIGG